jgi:hypothetical protein
MGRFKADASMGTRCPLCDSYFSMQENPELSYGMLPPHSIDGEVYDEGDESDDDRPEGEHEEERKLADDECPFSGQSTRRKPTPDDEREFEAALMFSRIAERLLTSDSFLGQLARALAERGSQ